MQSVFFDTHAYVKKLTKAGFTEEQAEIQAQTLTEFLEGQLATKQDTNALKRDIEELRIATTRDLEALELRLKHDLTLRLGGMMVTGIAVVAALVKLL
jgi:hypothetical protein